MSGNRRTCNAGPSDEPEYVASPCHAGQYGHTYEPRRACRLAGQRDTACGEIGEGRLAEPVDIAAEAERYLRADKGCLAGRHVLITSGPTHEPIDPVRYIANRSSGKQGHALAAACAATGHGSRLLAGRSACQIRPM